MHASTVVFATQLHDEPWDRLKGWRVADAVLRPTNTLR
jgi:hypothetical protein